VTNTHPVTPDLDTLVGLFYPATSELAEFEEVSAQEVSAPYDRLLAHNNHMTVTVEDFHHSPVDVHVLQKRVRDDAYARKILLARRSDSAVVQFGIMRIRFGYISQQARRDIESEEIPLGRVLISHNVMRQVELVSLWKVTPGAELRELLNLPSGEVIFGRTALIHVDGEPAVELLEIVTSG